MTGAFVSSLIRDLASLPSPALAEVERILGTRLPLSHETISFRTFKSSISRPPFARAELRVMKADPDWGLLVLEVGDETVSESELDIHAYGPEIRFDVSPDVPPEGIVSSTVQLGSVWVSFSLNGISETLRWVVLGWEPQGRR